MPIPKPCRSGGRTSTRSLRARLAAVLAIPALLHAAGAPLLAQDDEEPDRWRVVLDATYSGSSGNQNLSFFDGGFRVTHLQTDIAEFEWSARARSGTDDGERVAESYRTSLKADGYPEARWSPFVFGSAERDRFKELDLRTNAGGGVKYTFLRDEESEVSVSVAVLHSREDFRLPAEPTSTDGRLSWRVKGRQELRDGVQVEHISFYQPVWDEADDYLIESESILSVQVFSMLAVTAAYVYERNSTPPIGVESDDHNVKLGVQLQL